MWVGESWVVGEKYYEKWVEGLMGRGDMGRGIMGRGRR